MIRLWLYIIIIIIIIVHPPVGSSRRTRDPLVTQPNCSLAVPKEMHLLQSSMFFIFATQHNTMNPPPRTVVTKTT